MTKQSSPSHGSSPPLPSSPMMDISNLARLSESVWNTNSTTTTTKIIFTVRPLKLSSKIDLLSSDPVTSTDFGANHLFNKTPFSELPRNRVFHPPIPLHHSHAKLSKSLPPALSNTLLILPSPRQEIYLFRHMDLLCVTV